MAVNGSTEREIIGGLSGWAVASLGFLALVVGSGLFALATWRARSLSRTASVLLMVGSLSVLIGLAGAAGSLVPEALVPILILITVLVFPAGWVAMGVSALRIGQPATSLEGASL
jgi:hypothetical protein